MQNTINTISIVVPVYCGKSSLHQLCQRLKNSLETNFLSYEIILVNDACPENSWEVIKEICLKNNFVKGINLSKNFGQHYAISAGLSYAKYAWVVVMDCDLQDLPEEIPNLYSKALEGYDSVFAKRYIRNDNWIRRLQSNLFYKIFNFLTDTEYDSTLSNFGIYRQTVIQSILKMGDAVKFFPPMAQWVGFKKTTLIVKHNSRPMGKSSYSFAKLMSVALSTIISFSNKPLKIFVWFGFFMTFLSFTVGTLYLLMTLRGYFKVAGFPSLILSIWFLFGVTILETGVLGLYLEKTFNQVKRRPVFLVTDEININTN